MGQSSPRTPFLPIEIASQTLTKAASPSPLRLSSLGMTLLITVRYTSGFCSRQAAIAAAPCSRKSLCRASTKASPSLLREPGRGLYLGDFCACWPTWADTGRLGSGGWGGIRTPGGREPTPVFKTGALNHSATHPLEVFQLLSAMQFGTKQSETR